MCRREDGTQAETGAFVSVSQVASTYTLQRTSVIVVRWLQLQVNSHSDKVPQCMVLPLQHKSGGVHDLGIALVGNPAAHQTTHPRQHRHASTATSAPPRQHRHVSAAMPAAQCQHTLISTATIAAACHHAHVTHVNRATLPAEPQGGMA